MKRLLLYGPALLIAVIICLFMTAPALASTTIALWYFQSASMPVDARSGVRADDSVMSLPAVSSVSGCSDGFLNVSSWNANYFWEISSSSREFENITIEFQAYSTSTGPKNFAVLLLGDDGIFTDLDLSFTLTASKDRYSLNLGDAASDLNILTLRMISTDLSFNANGKTYLGNLKILGDAIEYAATTTTTSEPITTISTTTSTTTTTSTITSTTTTTSTTKSTTKSTSAITSTSTTTSKITSTSTSATTSTSTSTSATTSTSTSTSATISTTTTTTTTTSATTITTSTTQLFIPPPAIRFIPYAHSYSGEKTASIQIQTEIFDTYKPADLLYKLRLFSGVGLDENGAPIYELERSITRLEGLLQILRLLGEEEKARLFQGDRVFGDVPEWGERLTAYAFYKGLAYGVDDKHGVFAPERSLTYQEFTAMLLRVLGYREARGDFEFSGAIEKANDIRLYTGAGKLYCLRGDAVNSMISALQINLYGAEVKLIDTLALSGEQKKTFWDTISAG